jgi:tyrosine-protein kinase Etk/Wzc
VPQYEFQISDYERIFRKRYKIVVLSVICALVFSMFIARMKSPLFSATATVKVDRNSNMMGMDMESMMYDSWDNIETQTKVITSFPVLLLAGKRLHKVPDTLTEDNYATDDRNIAILEQLRGGVSPALTGGTNMIQITATCGAAAEARDLANAIAFAYKDFSVGGKKMHAIKTKQFVQEQLDLCKNDLQNAEQEVKAFEEGQNIPSIDESVKSTIDKSGKVDNELEMVDNALSVISMQQAKLMDRFNNPTDSRYSISAADSAHARSDTGAARIAGMRWVSDFTDDDPGIRRLNDRLLQLQIQLDDQFAYYKTNHPANKEIENRIKETIEQIMGEYEKKVKQLAAKREKLSADRTAVESEMQKLPGNQMQYARLLRKLKVNEELFTMLSKRLQEAMIAEAGVVDDVTIMSVATLPHGAINKGVSRIGVMGFFLGLLLGVILAVIREMFDTSIGTIEEVERTLKMTVLAVIPHIQVEDQPKQSSKQPDDKDTKDLPKINVRFRPGLITQFNPKDPCAEAYRILRTNLEYLSFQHPLRVLMITSATMQEGKSTTLANLAITFAQQGKRILILECNLRRPSLYRLLGLEKGPGISDILIEKAEWQNCVKNVTDLALGEFQLEEILSIPGLENFHIITYGQTPPNPAELLSSARMDELITDVRDQFDFVLVDAPPLLPVADSMVLATKVDGVVLVYRAGSVPRSSIKLAKERLETVQANILGVVLNDIRPETSGAHYTSVYSKYYGKDDPRHAKKKQTFWKRLLSKKTIAMTR